VFSISATARRLVYDSSTEKQRLEDHLHVHELGRFKRDWFDVKIDWEKVCRGTMAHDQAHSAQIERLRLVQVADG